MLPALGVHAIFAGPSGDTRPAAGLEQRLASSASLIVISSPPIVETQ